MEPPTPSSFSQDLGSLQKSLADVTISPEVLSFAICPTCPKPAPGSLSQIPSSSNLQCDVRNNKITNTIRILNLPECFKSAVLFVMDTNSNQTNPLTNLPDITPNSIAQKMRFALDAHEQRITIIENQLRHLNNNIANMNDNITTNLQSYHQTIVSHTQQLQQIQNKQTETATRLSNTTTMMKTMNDNIAKIASTVSKPTQNFPTLSTPNSNAASALPTWPIQRKRRPVIPFEHYKERTPRTAIDQIKLEFTYVYFSKRGRSGDMRRTFLHTFFDRNEKAIYALNFHGDHAIEICHEKSERDFVRQKLKDNNLTPLPLTYNPHDLLPTELRTSDNTLLRHCQDVLFHWKRSSLYAHAYTRKFYHGSSVELHSIIDQSIQDREMHDGPASTSQPTGIAPASPTPNPNAVPANSQNSLQRNPVMSRSSLVDGPSSIQKPRKNSRQTHPRQNNQTTYQTLREAVTTALSQGQTPTNRVSSPEV